MNILEALKLKKADSIPPVAGEVTQKWYSPSVWWSPLKIYEKVLLVIFAVLFLFIFYVTLDANKYQATVRVIEGEGRVGINPTTERLDFGDLSPGTSAVRRVSVENGIFIPIYVAAFRLGGITDLMKQDKNFFVLKKGEKVELEFSVYMPASAKPEDVYGGRIFLFKIPTFGIGS